MATESELQLLAEGSGPKVRTLKVTDPSAVDATGAAQADDARHQQVIAVADRHGDLDRGTFEAEAIALLREIAESLTAISMRLS